LPRKDKNKQHFKEIPFFYSYKRGGEEESVGTLFNTNIYLAIAVFPENPPKVKQEKVK
jgi:hypothetical protein